jgi:hypothetical protein
VALISYFLTPSSEPKLTNPVKVQEAIKNLKFSNAPGLYDILNSALKHLPRRAVTNLATNFNAVHGSHHFPTAWKHAKDIAILGKGKDPALPSSFRPINPLDSIKII